MLPPITDDGVVIVTGASSGIGEEIAREFARRGYRLVLVARRADRLRDLAEELAGRAHVLPADLSNRDERATLPDQVAALGVVADILVNNAGLATLGPVAEASPEAELNLIEVDVAAVVDLCSRFVPSMVKRGRGAVLNVASVGAFGPLPGQASYGAAKAFVLSYTQAMREELRGTGVTAAALCPGPVHTGFLEAEGIPDEEAEKVAAEIPMAARRRRGQGRGRRNGVGQGRDHSRCCQPDRVGVQPPFAAAPLVCRSSRATIPG